MKNNTIKYKISGFDHRITFCLDTEAADISSDMSRLIADKKILLVVDKNISKEVIKNIFKDLSQSDFEIKFLTLLGGKSISNKTLCLFLISNFSID